MKTYRLTEDGIQAMPENTPPAWGPDAIDFQSLELARFARMLLRGNKPRVEINSINRTPINADAHKTSAG
jgi:hypothetical protein